MVRTPSPRPLPATALPGRTSGVAALADELRPVLVRLGRRLRQEPVIPELGSAHAAVLTALGHGPVTVGELAAREQMRVPSIVVLLAPLEARGLVRRSPDPADRRRVWITRTVEGDRLALTARRARTAWLAAQLQRLDSTERLLVARALPALERLLLEEL
ncbi:MAG TPA: MarR family transcriptional regulator [Candidatus Micrarchaeia archaeon]|nr:MarR family transcriptional regulator [Candidatus Micrarchaeia archaeon]